MSQSPYPAPGYYENQQNGIGPVPAPVEAPPEKKGLHDANPPTEQVRSQEGQQQQQHQYVAPPQNPVYQHQAGPALPPSSDWSNNFWSFVSPIDLCCFGYWCPCVLYGQTHARLADPQLEKWKYFSSSVSRLPSLLATAQQRNSWLTSESIQCFAWAALSYVGCGCILQTVNRGDIRRRHGIDGSGALDCLGATCCPLCGLIQEEKEVKRRTGQALAGSGGYVKPQGGMHYPATAH
ncbi:MAG: hypothetical protein M1829_004448 [Trizodia sp. TS-e1964]|nr:MAG: hypothetical protein M1829_004448 [Trizodia sp. TS-e1964]